MPGATEVPAVSLSFANNFWGKDDAGVGPLLDRMASAKQTNDELRSFYGARASIEEEYARKLMSLCRKSLGSHEMGTLKTSLDTVRGELESMAKQHSGIAAQMKTELEEPLAAFAGGMKERRKIIQHTVEKLLKIKIQQTQAVNKTRDRYEQECLKIKGYLAQGHMVMGQEERKNKAKLEKTQISLATSNTEYENAVKALEDTTARWNREWKAAADKFQDLEEERLDFTKGSLWTFANVSSTVCVSDDASCEKIRLSLEKMDVEKDIINFISERGTGQEIPDPPKYINFCRGDVDDHQSEISEDDNYSVAQFPRSINPAFRTSSPQPSTFESHHDPNSSLARELAHQDPPTPSIREATIAPQKTPGSINSSPGQSSSSRQNDPSRQDSSSGDRRQGSGTQRYDASHFASVPHDPYPMDGMTMLCRTDGMNSATSSNLSARPSSRDDHSDDSNPTSFSSQEPPSGKESPVKQEPVVEAQPEKRMLKKRSGFFQNRSPFRRKSIKDVQPPNRNTWGPVSTTQNVLSPRRPQAYQPEPQDTLADRTVSPEPIEANASLALNVGQNVFPVANTDKRNKAAEGEPAQEDQDPIALALAELKGVAGNKQSSIRISADRYHGLSTPVPERTQDKAQDRPQSFSRSVPTPSVPAPRGSSDLSAGLRGTPPPSYDQPVRRLGVPPPAVTSRAMQESSRKYAEQTRDMFSPKRPGSGTYSSSPSRPTTRGNDMPRAASPAPPRSASPRPSMHSDTRQSPRSVSPNPYTSPSQQRNSPQASIRSKRGSDQGYYRQNSPNDMARSVSPSPYRSDYSRPTSRDNSMAVQLAPVGGGGDGSVYGGSVRSSRGNGNGGRPGTSSSSSRALSFYGGGDPMAEGSRQRSKSVADPSRQYTPGGRAILHYARALYMYQAAIPEELGFAKGDVLAVLRHQDDGWWEAEIHSGNGVGRGGLTTLAHSLTQEYIKTSYQTATSPAAKRTYLSAFLFLATSLALLCIAALTYPVFYYNYVPQKVISVPVHLQYNSGIHPYGVTSISPSLMYEQAYDVSVELTLPRSPRNLEKGNFMVALFALKSQPDNPAFAFSVAGDPHEHVRQENLVFMSRRPTLIPYADPLVSTASRVLFLLYHVLYPGAAERTTLVIPMGELVEFRDVLPLSLLLDVEAGQSLQVYAASVTLVARLTGVRWAMYNHRVLSFVVCTAVFWLFEMLFAGVAWLVLGYYVFNRGAGSGAVEYMGGRGDDSGWRGREESEPESEPEPENTRIASGYEVEPGIKQEAEDVKVKEESEEPEAAVEYPQHAGDADDEEDDDEQLRRVPRAGSSFDDGRGAGLRRRSSRGGASS
ncbi:hypothetical protein F4779DRAFT_630376 [Xylariaceae sp. FL0662B]|nr:hypothetical protein F4779DRAFT_630376 [Xylariaceae sp. FL0662B]